MFYIILNFILLEKWGMMMGVGILIILIVLVIGLMYGGILIFFLFWYVIFLFLIFILLFFLFMGLFVILEIFVKKIIIFDLVSLIGIVLLFSGLLMFLSKIGILFGWFLFLVVVIGFVIFYKWVIIVE